MTVDYPARTYVTHEEIATASISTSAGSTPVIKLQKGFQDDLTAPPNAKDLGFSISNPGSGLPMSNLPPTRLGAYYLKL